MTDTTNPKDAIASAKLPLHLWPASATVYGVLGLMEGMNKYGRSNWRATEVRASVYVSALKRHLEAWTEGEEVTAEGGPHLGNALACLAILVDAHCQGTLIDDRNFSKDAALYAEFVKKATEMMATINKNVPDRGPKHWDHRDVFLSTVPTMSVDTRVRDREELRIRDEIRAVTRENLEALQRRGII